MIGIREFFVGKTIFLTGVTGLVGKLVLEKLLRCCEGVEKIYILVRAKKGKDASQRIKEICDTLAFQKLKAFQPDFFEKISIIEGDLENQPAFTIDENILQNINIIIHCAATVRFNEPLKRATFINVRGTKQLLDCARKIKNLLCFIYVSTAFSFCPNPVIEEKIYNVPIDAKSLIDKMENVSDEDWLKDFEKRIVPKWPNTYAFTKGVTENLLLEYNDLPIGVTRPSILLGCAKEPLVGWTDNVLGITGIMVGTGIGIIRAIPVKGHYVTDLLPVDYAVNLILAATWDVANTQNDGNNLKIFNCVSGPNAPITWKQLQEYSLPMGCTHAPTCKAIWYPFCLLIASTNVYHVAKFFLHILPSYLFDALAVVKGRKERLSKVYVKVHEAIDCLTYFTTNQWKFKDENTKRLWKRMSDEERKMFYFSTDDLEWKQAIVDSALGVRRYLLNEPDETIEDGKRLIFKLKLAHYFFVGLLLYLFVWLFYSFVL